MALLSVMVLLAVRAVEGTGVAGGVCEGVGHRGAFDIVHYDLLIECE